MCLLEGYVVMLCNESIDLVQIYILMFLLTAGVSKFIDFDVPYLH